MKKIKAIAAVVLLSTAFAVSARESVPIINHENVAVTARSGVAQSTAGVRASIIKALQTKGWTYAEPSPGLITGSLVVRNKHTIGVDIPYSATSYSLKYRDSVNMNYEPNGTKRAAPGPQSGGVVSLGPVIHPNYNAWVGQLMAEINAEISRN